MLQTLHDCEDFVSQDNVTSMGNIPPQTIDCINNFEDILFTAMSDDLHTPDVLAALSDPLKTANDLLHTKKVYGFRTTFSNKLN